MPSFCSLITMLFTAVYLLFPLLVFTAVVPLHRSVPVDTRRLSIGEASPGALGDIDTDIYNGRVEFDLLRPDADESLSFIFEVTPPIQPVPCGNSALYLNGQPLVQEWEKQGDAAGHEHRVAHGDVLDVSAASSLTVQDRVLRVNSSSYCLPWQPENEQSELAEHVFELTTVDILRVGDEESVASFAVLFDQARRHIFGLKRNTKDDILLVEWVNSLAQQHIASLAATDLSDEVNDNHNVHDGFTIEQEIALLQDLQWDLEVLKSTIKDQQIRIHLLNIEASKKFKNQLSQCKSVGCYIREIARKLKRCIHMLLASITANHTTKSPQLHCVAPSPFAQAKVMMTGRPICGQGTVENSPTKYPADKIASASPKNDLEKGGKAISSENVYGDPPPQYSEYERPRPHIDDESRRQFEAETKLHTLLFVAASVFCFGCVAVAVQRRCMSPRSRAEWMARREERRVAREYRQLARRQAMHNWMSRLMPRSLWRQDQQRMNDYEEKRNLIIQQEGVLEEVMQDELRRLTCNDAHAAEQGQGLPPASRAQLRAGTSRASTHGGAAESLPSYRNRSYSGRPPSYRSVDPNPVVDVANGFPGYTPGEAPSRAANASPVSDIASSSSDVTPDSSVREISPRQSSETLRTDRSVL